MGSQSKLLLSLLVVGLTVATNNEHVVKRQLVTASQLRDAYDFVIAGGGTSGLTVADRLSEAFPGKTVLVIEYGQIEEGVGSFDPPSQWETSTPGAAGSWDFFSKPNPIMNNKTAYIKVGKTVGGGSAVNGQFFDRGSRHDYDAWEEVYGNSSPNNIKWDWKGIVPYFKKSVTFTKPSPADAQKYGYTWDIDAAYGGNTPIFSSYPPFQWADQKIVSQAYQELGLRIPKECAGGDKHGVCWVPTSEHPVTMRRSHSGLGHYALVQGSRSNYDLLVKHQVVRIVYPGSSTAKASKPTRKKHQPPLVEVKDVSSASIFNITVKAEVIISAGAFNTPAILQRSGIGPPAFLQSAGIPLVIDSPGVGANLQDHGGAGLNWNLTVPYDPPLFPVPNDLLTNSSYYSLAVSQFDQTPAQGPFTIGMGNSAVYVSLPKAAPDSYQSIISKLRSLASPSSTSLLASYLPPGPDYASNTAMVAGYRSQLLTLANLLSDPTAPSNESPFATTRHPGVGPNAWAFLLHPLSRGTVHINVSDPLGQPILDYRAGTNPLDFDLHISHLKFLRKLVDTPTFKKYGAVETSPGESVQTDDQWKEYVKQGIILSFQHPCCTAALMSRERGGVVGRDLKVHGAEELGGGLRVADMSITPLLVGSHTSATAYAVGEKAADIIIMEWSTGGRH
ncbi:GMC oxidoreductase [Naviculisporaceae sp. PSN 640]